jgi:hypothetical protein
MFIEQKPRVMNQSNRQPVKPGLDYLKLLLKTTGQPVALKGKKI